MSVKRRDTD